MSAKRGKRVLGPYAMRDKWRVVEVDALGKKSSVLFDTDAKAERYAEIARAELDREDYTTASAFAEYRAHLTTRETKVESINVTQWAVDQFFPTSAPLSLLTAKRCEKLHEDLRTRPSPRTKKPLAVDTHRNVLAQVKSFLSWCVERGYLPENPAAEIKGIGTRRPRGKSLGKAGIELRVKQARAVYAKAVELASDGDDGATAVLVALLLGLRAGEIVSRRVGDLDEDQGPADLLWIPCAKTPAGRRTLEVPDVLAPSLAARGEGRAAERYLFERDTRPGGASQPHWRDWVLHNVHRVCDLAGAPRVTAHAMRGLLATLTAERGSRVT